MPNPAFRRALASLSHPLSIGAILLLLINDHIWRKVAPSWLTGKVGDFAWLIFAPFLLAALLAWLWPKREALVGRVSIIGTGVIFALAKGVPFFNVLMIDLLERANGWSNSLRVDPTDLLVLPALGLAWWIWTRKVDRLPAYRSGVLIVLAVLTTTGTSPAMYPTGVRTISDVNGVLYSYDFHSRNGGLAWEAGGDTKLQTYSNHYGVWQLIDPSNERVVYRFTPGVSIERSDDGGATWRREFNLGGEEARLASLPNSGYMALGPFDALIHRSTGNLVVAMGLEGVLVRQPSGEWRWVSVGSFSVPELKRPAQIAALLSNELWLGVALVALIASTLTLRFNLWSIIKTMFVIGLIGLWIAGWVYWVASYTYQTEGVLFKLAVMVLTGLSVWLGRGPRWRRMTLIVAWLIVIVWGVSTRSFWRYGGEFSMAIGVVLVLFTLAVGLRLRRRQRSDTALVGFVSVVAMILMGVWPFWIYDALQRGYWQGEGALASKLFLGFALATVGLTVATALAWPRLKREIWAALWGIWLVWGFALAQRNDLWWGGATLALVLISLGVVAIFRKRAVLDRVVKVLVVVGWIGWALTLIAFDPAIPSINLINGEMITVPMLLIGAILIGPRQIGVAYRQQRRAWLSILMLGLGGGVLYLLPYVLWTQGGIPFYDSATLYAIALAMAVTVGGYFYVRRIVREPKVAVEEQPVA